MSLADDLAAVARRQQIESWDKSEAELLARLELPQPDWIDDATRADLQPFIQWTEQANVRYCPAKAHVIAAYVLHEAATGASTETILRRVNAISALHSRHNLADPVSTASARFALQSAIPAEPPRSWRKAEKQAFIQLPPEVKSAIHRRDHERETEVRRLQNLVSELKKTANTTAPESKPVDISEKETLPMAKKDKGVGA